MKINGWIYLIIGAIISGYSKFVQLKNDNYIMTFFFYVGILFVVIGLFKIIVKFITSPKNKESEVEEEFYNSPKKDFSGSINKNSNSRAIICPRCTARLHPKSRYCNWCGYKLKK